MHRPSAGQDGGLYTEREYKDAARNLLRPSGIDPEPFVAFLIEFQRLNDAGGDLDTIGSNSLYAAWLMQAWKAKYGVEPRYGRDYQFDFVNYHQSFMHLLRHRDSEIYLPDFPMDAILDLRETAIALKDVGSRFVFIDDHHPTGPEKVALLDELKAEGLIEDWRMSGHIKGQPEEPPEHRTCGTDLVHIRMLAGTPYDNPGLDELRRLAHQQDLGLVENPDDREHPDYLAVDLSKLIGSKHSRIDMVQELMYVRSFSEMRGIMESTGWRQIVDQYEQDLEGVLPKLDECMAVMDFVTNEDVEKAREKLGFLGMVAKILFAITFGKIDLEGFLIARQGGVPVRRIYMTLSPFQGRKEHRINIASALNYSKRHFRYDYFFFAWGASLLSTRRFNKQEFVIDLSRAMPVIGGPGDGGHPSAATCKPPSNAAWPAEQFKKLNKGNFLEYANYIAGRLASGFPIRFVNIKMVTMDERDFK